MHRILLLALTACTGEVPPSDDPVDTDVVGTRDPSTLCGDGPVYSIETWEYGTSISSTDWIRESAEGDVRITAFTFDDGSAAAADVSWFKSTYDEAGRFVSYLSDSEADGVAEYGLWQRWEGDVRTATLTANLYDDPAVLELEERLFDEAGNAIGDQFSTPPDPAIQSFVRYVGDLDAGAWDTWAYVEGGDVAGWTGHDDPNTLYWGKRNYGYTENGTLESRTEDWYGQAYASLAPRVEWQISFDPTAEPSTDAVVGAHVRVGTVAEVPLPPSQVHGRYEYTREQGRITHRRLAAYATADMTEYGSPDTWIGDALAAPDTRRLFLQETTYDETGVIEEVVSSGWAGAKADAAVTSLATGIPDVEWERLEVTRTTWSDNPLTKETITRDLTANTRQVTRTTWTCAEKDLPVDFDEVEITSEHDPGW